MSTSAREHFSCIEAEVKAVREGQLVQTKEQNKGNAYPSSARSSSSCSDSEKPDEDLQFMWGCLEAQLVDQKQSQRSYFQQKLRYERGNARADATLWEDGNALDGSSLAVVNAMAETIFGTFKHLQSSREAMRDSMARSTRGQSVSEAKKTYLMLHVPYTHSGHAIAELILSVGKCTGMVRRSVRLEASVKLLRQAKLIMEREAAKPLCDDEGVLEAVGLISSSDNIEDQAVHNITGTAHRGNGKDSRPSTAPHTASVFPAAHDRNATQRPQQATTARPPRYVPQPPPSLPPKTAIDDVRKETAAVLAAHDMHEKDVVPSSKHAQKEIEKAVASKRGGSSKALVLRKKDMLVANSPRTSPRSTPRHRTVPATAYPLRKQTAPNTTRAERERIAREEIMSFPEEKRTKLQVEAVLKLGTDTVTYRSLNLAEKQIIQELEQRELVFHHKRAVMNMKRVGLHQKEKQFESRLRDGKPGDGGEGEAVSPNRPSPDVKSQRAEFARSIAEVDRQLRDLCAQRSRDVHTAIIGLARQKRVVDYEALAAEANDASECQ